MLAMKRLCLAILLVVNALNSSHYPFTLSDLSCNITTLRVHKVKMVPSISFGHPNQLVCCIDEVPKALAGIIDKRFTLLVDNGRYFAILGTDTY